MIRDIIRTAVAVLSRTAYEDGLEKGARLVSADLLETRCQELADETERAERLLSKLGKFEKERDEARAELEAVKADRDRILRELGANLGNAPEPGEIKRRVSELYAELEVAKEELVQERDTARIELAAQASTARALMEERDSARTSAKLAWNARDEWQARAEKAEAALKSQPAAFPWSDEAVERAYTAFQKTVSRYGSDDMQEEAELAGIGAALATLAPPPQAAPVPPVGVGDVWGDAVRAVYSEAEDHYEVRVGDTLVRWFNSRADADEEVRLIRRGLDSLPPLRAVLVGGVTEGMVAAVSASISAERNSDKPWKARLEEGLTATLAAANIRVLGPGEGVVRVRVAKAGEKCPSGSVYRLPASHWYGSGAGGSVCETSEAWYILAADLDAAAAGLGKGGANG